MRPWCDVFRRRRVERYLADRWLPSVGRTPPQRRRRLSPRRRHAVDVDGLGPERRLMLAVLEDALAALRHAALQPSRQAQRLADEVREWMGCEDRTWPFSFANICDGLDVDAERLRRRHAPAHAARAGR